MSRKKRIWYPGATYHVMSRGNRRTVLFKDTSDYKPWGQTTLSLHGMKFAKMNKHTSM